MKRDDDSLDSTLDRHMGRAGEPPAGQVASSVDAVWERLRPEAECSRLPAPEMVTRRSHFTVAVATVVIATVAIGLYAAQRTGLLQAILPVRQPAPPQVAPASPRPIVSGDSVPDRVTIGGVEESKEPAPSRPRQPEGAAVAGATKPQQPSSSTVAKVTRPQETDAGVDSKPAQGTSPQPRLAIQEIKPNLYVVTGAGANVTVRVTPGGVIVVDTKNPGDQFYDGLMAEIKKVTDKPVRYVVVTSHNLDHGGNIGKFIEAGVQVIGHDNVKNNLTVHVPPYRPGLGLQPPNVTYAKDRTIELGGVIVQIRHARAQTSGNSIVYFPDLKVVSVGDCVVGTAPFLDFPFDGSALEWQNVLDDIGRLDFDTLVPGHPGEFSPNTMTRAEFIAFKTKFDTMMARAKDLVKRDTPKESFLSQFKVDDLGWNALLRQLTNPVYLDPFYAELQAGKARPLP